MLIYGSKVDENLIETFKNMDSEEKKSLVLKTFKVEGAFFIGVECPSNEVNKKVVKLSILAIIDQNNVNKFLKKMKLSGNYYYLQDEEKEVNI